MFLKTMNFHILFMISAMYLEKSIWKFSFKEFMRRSIIKSWYIIYKRQIRDHLFLCRLVWFRHNSLPSPWISICVTLMFLSWLPLPQALGYPYSLCMYGNCDDLNTWVMIWITIVCWSYSLSPWITCCLQRLNKWQIAFVIPYPSCTLVRKSRDNRLNLIRG